MSLPLLPTFLQVIGMASFYATLLAAVVLAVQNLARRRLPARYRFALWFLVLVRLTAMPLPQSRVSLLNLFAAQPAAGVASSGDASMAVIPPLKMIQPRADSSIASLSASPQPPRVSESVQLLPESAPRLANAPGVSVPLSLAQKSPGPPPVWSMPWKPVLEILYFAGVAGLLLRFLLATWALRRIVHRAEPLADPAVLASLEKARITLGLRRQVPLLVTDALPTPAVTGVIRPVLLLPRELLATLSAQDLHFVFLHECAHLRRHDILINCWLSLLGALHWFNPAVWMLIPRIGADRELACDELVLNHTTDPALYGHTLLRIVETLVPARSLSPAVGILETKTSLKRRIHMIAAFHKTPRWLAVASGIALLALAAATLTNAALPTPAAAPLPANKPQTPVPATSGDSFDTIWRSAGVLEPYAQKDPVVRTLLDQRNQAEKQKGDLETLFGANHPNVVAVNAKLKSLNHDLNQHIAEDIAASTPSTAVNQSTPKEQTSAGLNSQTLSKLETPIEGLSNDQIGLDKAIDILCHECGCNVAVNWNSLAKVGIDRNQPVSVNLKNVPARKILRTVLDEVGGGVGNIDYIVEDGVITISTRDDVQAIARRSSSVAAGAPLTNATMAEMQKELEQLTKQREELLSRGNPNVPQIATINEQVDAIRSLIAGIREGITGVSMKTAPTPAAGPAPAKNADLAIQVFDVHALIGMPPGQSNVLTNEQRAACDQLAITIKNSILNADPDATVNTFNGMLILSASPKLIEKTNELIEQIVQRQEEERQMAAENSVGQSAVPSPQPH